MRLASLALVLVGGVGCGGGGSGNGGSDGPRGPVCGAAGNGDVSGTVNGVTLGAITGASGIQNTPFNALQVVLDDKGAACTGTQAGDNDLAILICELPPSARTYAISSAIACSSGVALAQLQTNNGSAAGSASGGSVTVTSSTTDCVTGTFDIEFGSQKLTGDFAAVSCDLTGSNDPH